MIDTSVERRAEGGQPQAGRPRLGRPAPNCLISDQTNATDFIRRSRTSNKKGTKFDGDNTRLRSANTRLRIANKLSGTIAEER